MKHTTLIGFSGITWFLVGLFLLSKGLSLIALHESDQQMALIYIFAGLLVGFIKGRFVLSKTVHRLVSRIVALSMPVALKDVYSRGYLLLIAGMMGLGFLFKWLPIPLPWKGFIDVAIGSALINGAILFFRNALAYRQKTQP
jgi:hypothetical protein